LIQATDDVEQDIEVLGVIGCALIFHGNAATREQGRQCWKKALDLRKVNVQYVNMESTCVNFVNAISKSLNFLSNDIVDNGEDQTKDNEHDVRPKTAWIRLRIPSKKT
jgi:hypothetical protein